MLVSKRMRAGGSGLLLEELRQRVDAPDIVRMTATKERSSAAECAADAANSNY